MSTRRIGRQVASVALAALFVLLALVGTGTVRLATASPVETDTTPSLAETAVAGFSFTERAYQNLPTNMTINVTFYNDDSTDNDHTFTILNRSDWVIPSSASPGPLLAHYGALLNLPSNPGQTATAQFRAPATGWYEFFCNISGHFQLGMYGYIAFGMALPPNLSFGSANPPPGTAVFIIVGSISSLTVLAIVLGFVVGRREGAIHEMAPERLGYPEPAPPPTAQSPEPPKPGT